jgi:hypothetical protein
MAEAQQKLVGKIKLVAEVLEKRSLDLNYVIVSLNSDYVSICESDFRRIFAGKLMYGCRSGKSQFVDCHAELDGITFQASIYKPLCISDVNEEIAL